VASSARDEGASEVEALVVLAVVAVAEGLVAAVVTLVAEDVVGVVVEVGVEVVDELPPPPPPLPVIVEGTPDGDDIRVV